MQRTDSVIVRADLIRENFYSSDWQKLLGLDVVMIAEEPLLPTAEGGSSIGVLADWVVGWVLPHLALRHYRTHR